MIDVTRQDTAWMLHGACTARPGLAWLDGTDRVPDVVVAEMVAVCANCPVRDLCAAYIETADVTGGFWAGSDRNAADRWTQDSLPGLDTLGEVA